MHGVCEGMIWVCYPTVDTVWMYGVWEGMLWVRYQLLKGLKLFSPVRCKRSQLLLSEDQAACLLSDEEYRATFGERDLSQVNTADVSLGQSPWVMGWGGGGGHDEGELVGFTMFVERDLMIYFI